ncbi:hypothetical protein [Phosphitispora fastidiosa]|uniref:hypothetical protein n=1 Tax=Phosphitispora fastidiosa TaxID=2837202 RepID=UPI001E408541|nr:hypothetical protein [Phosphitispora fastidiosa]MBU7006323.1 hypothetical protein [Phosphitispora fastidiosa]
MTTYWECENCLQLNQEEVPDGTMFVDDHEATCIHCSTAQITGGVLDVPMPE